MKKTSVVLMFVAALAFVSCADKMFAAKASVTFIGLAVTTAKSVVVEVAKVKAAECAEQACKQQSHVDAVMLKECMTSGEVIQNPAYHKCYASTKKMIDATDLLWPQIDQALVLTNKAIATAGGEKDVVGLIKAAACLLVKLSTWIPANYRAKVETWINLAGAFACGSSKPNVKLSPERSRFLLAKLRVLLIELGAKA